MLIWKGRAGQTELLGSGWMEAELGIWRTDTDGGWPEAPVRARQRAGLDRALCGGGSGRTGGGWVDGGGRLELEGTADGRVDGSEGG